MSKNQANKLQKKLEAYETQIEEIKNKFTLATNQSDKDTYQNKINSLSKIIEDLKSEIEMQLIYTISND